MNLRRAATALSMALFLSGVPALHAQSARAADPLAVTLTLSRVQTADDGKEALVETPSVKPGELVEYRAVYANKGAQTLNAITATVPLPVGMEYIPMSGRPVAALASTDGVNFAPEPLTRTVKGKDGKPVKEAIPYSEYRALRWGVSQIEPGKAFEARVRARVSTATPAPLASNPAAPAQR